MTPGKVSFLTLRLQRLDVHKSRMLEGLIHRPLTTNPPTHLGTFLKYGVWTSESDPENQHLCVWGEEAGILYLKQNLGDSQDKVSEMTSLFPPSLDSVILIRTSESEFIITMQNEVICGFLSLDYGTGKDHIMGIM